MSPAFKMTGAAQEQYFSNPAGSLVDMLEVVVWNEVYLKVADILAPGRVVELKGTLDRRDEMFRATAVEIKPLTVAKPNGANDRATESSVNRRFSCDFPPRPRAMSCGTSGTF